jgi:hypothetical protein
MNMATKNNIFKEHLKEYLKASRARKGEILTHVCFVSGMKRKSAIRKFKRLQMAGPAPPKKRGRKTRYGPDVTAALRTVWEAGGEVCGELLHPVINEYIDILERDRMWKHPANATALLRRMSEATVKRRVGTFIKARKRRKGISATKPSHLKKLVPVFTGPWHDKPPGYGQIDSVRHSDSASGDAVCTINYADAATFLVVPRAQFNLGQRATQQSMAAIQKKLPFPWLGAHPDSGSEYLNHFVKDWCDQEEIELSRSRPNKKNDNMYVEERNGHVVRKYVGYMKLDCPEAADALNELYDVLYYYLLHFVAVRRQMKRMKVKSKYIRKYEKKAKTPYQRILEHPKVNQAVKDKLKQEHQRLNPLVLKREIDRLTKKVYDTQQRYGSQGFR